MNIEKQYKEIILKFRIDSEKAILAPKIPSDLTKLERDRVLTVFTEYLKSEFKNDLSVIDSTKTKTQA